MWKGIQVTLHSCKMESSEWETILPDTPHSIRSLLRTATNTTPHERLFNFTRKSTAEKSIPSWIKPGPVYIKNHTRTSKNQPPVIKATVLDVNSRYAHVKLPSGTGTMVNIRDIAPHQESVNENHNIGISVGHRRNMENHHVEKNYVNETNDNENETVINQNNNITINNDELNETNCVENVITQSDFIPRRSSRNRKMPQKYDDYVTE